MVKSKEFRIWTRHLVIPFEVFFDEDLKYVDHYIYMLLTAIQGPPEFPVTAEILSGMMDVNDRTVRRSIRRLFEKDYIKKNNGGYILNPTKITLESYELQERIEEKIDEKYYRQNCRMSKKTAKSTGLDQEYITPENQTKNDDYRQNCLKSKNDDSGKNANIIYNQYQNIGILNKDKNSTLDTESSKNSPSDKSDEGILKRRSTKTIITMGLREKEEQPVEKKIEIPEPIKKIMDCWTSNGFPRVKSSSKSYEKTIRSLKRLRAGRFFNSLNPKYKECRFSEEQITSVIKRFALAAFDKEYEPRTGEYKDKLKKMSLYRFLYNDFATNEENKSLFIKYFEKPPRALRQSQMPTEDQNPVITRIFKKWFVRHVTGVQVSFSEIDERNFQEGGVKLLEFLKSNRKNMADGMSMQNEEFAKILCNAILASTNDQPEKISTKWFCSDFTFNKRLPAYLNAQGFFRENYDGSPIYDDDVNIRIYDEN